MRIKKILKLIIILFFLCLLVLTIIKINTKKYDIIYEKNNHIINEIYEQKNKNHNYEINIKNKEYEVSFLINEKFNKNKRIIKELKVYEEKNIICLLPIYKKNINLNLYCLEDNKQVSNYYLKDNNSYKKILKKVKKYNIEKYKETKSTKKYKNIQIYSENIDEEDIFTVWDYKGINIIEKGEIKYQKILNYDLYDNIKSIIYDKYFILFENNKVEGIKNIHYYDLKLL